MSQRGPAPRPASRHSSLSPAKDASSPASHRSLTRQDDSSIQPPDDPGGLHLTESGARRQSRTSGVHDILNPPDPRGGEALAGSGPRPNIKEESPPHPVMGSGQYGGDGSPSHHYMYPHQGTTTPQQLQQPRNPMNQPPLPGRGSPSTSYAHLAAGRRILTPRSPRQVSYNRTVSRNADLQRMSPNPPRSGPPPHETSPPSGSQAIGESYPFPGPTRGPGTAGPPPPTRPTSGLSRSLSQPIIGHRMPAPRQDLLNQHAQQPSQGRGLSSLPGAYPPGSPFPPQFPPQFPPGRGPGGHGVMGPWRLGPGPQGYGQSGGGSGLIGLRLAEGQQHMIITPEHGEKIVVPVNTHEGSKQMNEKRQRNAGASARFRYRKKIKEQSAVVEMQQKDIRIRELERRVQEVEEEREFYMNGGGRGEFVPRPRSPTVERGQSSPVSSKSGSSFPDENSPIPAPSAPSSAPPLSHAHPFPQARSHTLAHPHPSPISYGDPSMLERPTRRRRIDSAPELMARSYVSSPPIPPPAYGLPPSPHLAGQPGPPGSARLPPLRFDQPGSATPTPPPAPTGVPPPPVPQQHRSGGQYSPHRRDSYNTAGWATEYKEDPQSGPR